ncbi:MAG: ABC transporter permease [Gammaproteobacteria bacterium]|nr:ABC transporter permease [Gammaproteobacteria bacterium]MDE0443224.1 ABC transporter permease [Gammaproteobacteria bacterium]
MSEILQITLVGLRSIPRRLGESCEVAIGIGCVVWVLVMALAMLGSLTNTIRTTGHPDRALVLRNGAVAESLSSLARDEVARLRSLPGIARLQGGDVAMSAEVLISVMLGDVHGLVLVRGLAAAGFELRPELALVEGRMLEQGKHELIVGRLAQRSTPSLAIGSHLRVNAVDWRIVGVFESGGDVHESEILADGPTLMAAVGRDEFSSATVRLTSAQDFETFRGAVSSIPGANLAAERESAYYEGQSETMSRLVSIVAYVVCTIMAIGATCGALNMTYSIVEARTTEVATLRAIGFGATPIMVSILAESTVLAIIGASLGALLAWVVGDGNAFAATQFLGPGASVNQLTLRLEVAAEHVAFGMLWACAIGLIGASLPGYRIARSPIARGLQVA